MALVCGIRSARAFGVDQGVDRARLRGRQRIFIPACHWRVASLAKVPPPHRLLAFLCDCRPLAHSCWTPQYRRRPGPRFFLVLFCERTLSTLLGQTFPARLQQDARGRLLAGTFGLALSLESVPAAHAAPSFAWPWHPHLRGKDAAHLLDLCRTGADLLRHLHQQ